MSVGFHEAGPHPVIHGWVDAGPPFLLLFQDTDGRTEGR